MILPDPLEGDARRRTAALFAEWFFLAGSAGLLLFPNGGSYLVAGWLLIGIATRKWLLGRWRLASAADPFWALFLLTALMGVWVSTDVSVSLNRLALLLLAWLCNEAIMVTVSLIGLPPRLLLLLGLASSGLAAFCLVATEWSAGILVPFPALYDRLPQLAVSLPGSGIVHSGGLINPRATAGALLLLIPLNLTLIGVHALSKVQRGVHAAAVFLLAGTLLLTQSPQAIAALAVAGVVLVLGLLRGRARLSALVLLLIVAAGGVWLIGSSGLTWAAVLDGRAGFGLVARFEIWVRAIRMILAAPFTGIGLNGYAAIMDAFYPGYVLGPEAHAHNTLLQTLTDQGMLGAIALMGLTGLAFWSSGRVAANGEEPRIRMVGLGIFAALSAWLVYGTVDVLSLGNKQGLLLSGYMAIPMALQWHRHGRSSRAAWIFVTGTSALLLLFGWGSGLLEQNLATVEAQQALASNASRPVVASDAFARLAALDARYGTDPHRLRLQALLLVALNNPEAAARAFRALAAAEAQLPLWWWSPAAVLTGEMQNEPAPVRAEGLLKVYQHWQTRFPARVEPAILLGYGYTDAVGAPERGLHMVEGACASPAIKEKVVLQAVLLSLGSAGCPLNAP